MSRGRISYGMPKTQIYTVQVANFSFSHGPNYALLGTSLQEGKAGFNSCQDYGNKTNMVHMLDLVAGGSSWPDQAGHRSRAIKGTYQINPWKLYNSGGVIMYWHTWGVRGGKCPEPPP